MSRGVFGLIPAKPPWTPSRRHGFVVRNVTLSVADPGPYAGPSDDDASQALVVLPALSNVPLRVAVNV
jgi:hypothetical protein